MPSSARSTSSPASGIGRIAVRTALLLIVIPWWASHSPPRLEDPADQLLRELSRTTAAPRIGAPLTIRPQDLPCDLRALPDETIERSACPPPRGGRADASRILTLSRRLRERGAGRDARALHALALVGLLWPDRQGKALDESLSSLRAASRLAERPAPVMADLAAGHLLRAERTQDARDLLEAIDYAEQALESEPDHPTARVNLALALERLGLVEEAEREWKRHRGMAPRSAWTDEARRRAWNAGGPPDAPKAPAPGATAGEVAAYVEAAPMEARRLGWETVLDEWGAAVLAGDTAAAGARLRLAEALGGALAARNGDATLADAVRAIHSQALGCSTRVLARAHREYAAARRAYTDREFATAADGFEQVLGLRPHSPALQAWALVMRETLRLVRGNYRLDPAIRDLAARPDTDRWSALVANARIVVGTAHLRAGSYEQARTAFRAAAGLLERTGERESVGRAQYLVTDAEFAIGQSAAAYASAHRALATLRPYRASAPLQSLLSVMGEEAAADGLLRAAVRLQDEGVAVAARTGHSMYLAEALSWRAQLLAAAGDLERARADVQAADTLVRSLEEKKTRDWFEADLRTARAHVLMREHPARAEAALDSVVAVSAGARTALRTLHARIWRARARLSLGDQPGAVEDLDSATTILAKQRDSVVSAPLRASLLDAAREVFDQIAMLQVGEGRHAEALASLERGRASFAVTRMRVGTEPRSGWRVPPGNVAVEYALIGDTLLIWTIAGRTVRMARDTIDRAALVGALGQARWALENPGSADAGRELATLYEWLVRPVASRLGPAGTPLVVVADGEIAAAPFAALYDASQKRYLVQDHPLRFASSLRDVSGPVLPATRPAGKALFVADPAFDPREEPGLERLSQAVSEVDTVARWYPAAEKITGPGARRAVLDTALTRAAVFHFAGHARFDDARPERSFLVLAADTAPVRSGRLTAAEIEGMDLRRVRLVVLSACETFRAREGRSGGFAGFAGALLASGAGGVVGSLWQVEERRTRALMTEFHRAYHASGDAPGALRAAQLRLLGSRDPVLRSPAAWAGFRYAGR